ncbi:MAG TPA: molybdate ABC transporter permease subunit [Myxococcales bacterium]|nr:molybdate ABC transporter permease subunit [Myxococcales bacterium]
MTTSRVPSKPLRWLLFSLPMILLLMLPMVALITGASWADLQAGLRRPTFHAALQLSLTTSLGSLFLIIVLGSPLAWWLAQGQRKGHRLVELLVNLPIVLPPAVMGLALLQTYGRQGLIGALGLPISFSSWGVVMAQVVVSAPFYILAAAAAFRSVDMDLIVVARSLGASPSKAFLKIALPLSLPGLIAGAALAWARALGEFGATLLFAGNLPGRTQTMPLAIYQALETDLRTAMALALVLTLLCFGMLFLLRWTSGRLQS